MNSKRLIAALALSAIVLIPAGARSPASLPSHSESSGLDNVQGAPRTGTVTPNGPGNPPDQGVKNPARFLVTSANISAFSLSRTAAPISFWSPFDA